MLGPAIYINEHRYVRFICAWLEHTEEEEEEEEEQKEVEVIQIFKL